MADKMTDLIGKPKLFAEAYLKHGKVKQAAIDAGYSLKTAASAGSRMLKNESVKAYLAAITEPATKAAGISHAFVLETLKEVVRRCMDDEAFNPAGASKALELIGKHLGTFNEGRDTAEERPAFTGIEIYMGGGALMMRSADAEGNVKEVGGDSLKLIEGAPTPTRARKGGGGSGNRECLEDKPLPIKDRPI